MELLGEWYGIAGFLVGMVIIFMLLGIPVAFAFLTANIIGAMIFMGGLDAMPQIVDQCGRVGDDLCPHPGARSSS